MPPNTRKQKAKPNLLWYQHITGGAKHGFDAAGIAQAQENFATVQRAQAQGLPVPVLPRHPMDDIAAQIRTGKLIPCEAPKPSEVNTLELSDEEVGRLEAADVQESKADKRARLLAELAELEEEGTADVPSAAGSVAGATGPDGTTPRGRGAKGGAQE